MLIMNFVLKPSLRHIAQVKIAAILWNRSDIRDAISQFSLLFSENKNLKSTWYEIEDKVKEKVQLLPLPELLKKDILIFIKPIGIQILRWIEYHISLDITLPQEFFWKSHGTIDRKRTAEILVKDEGIDISKRYKLSCIYCLENSVKELWSKMSENCRQSLNGENQKELVDIWTDIMREGITVLARPPTTSILIDVISGGSLDSMFSSYQYGFKLAACCGNIVGTEYFFEKLTSNKEAFLLKTVTVMIKFMGLSIPPQYEFIKEYSSETLCFLLSKLDTKQQRKIFKEFSVKVLNSFLEWPCHFLFSEVTSVMRRYFSTDSYNLLLNLIVDKVIEGYTYLNHKEIFEEIWEQSPDIVKRNVLKETVRNLQITIKAFQTRDKSIIELIFSNVTVNEKKSFIYSYNGQNICSDLIDSEEWDLLDYFIKESVVSKNEMIEFKKHVENNIIGNWSKDTIAKNKGKLLKCFQLLNDILYGFDKRKNVEENDTNQPKRLCSSDLC